MQKLFTRLAALLAVTMVAVAAAFAAPQFPTDGSPITSGTVYDVKAFVDYNATFVAPATGTLIQDGCADLKLNKGSETFVGWGGEYGMVYSWQVVAGETYVISNPGFVIQEGKVCFTMESDLGVQISRILPSEGSVISPLVNLSGDILFQFNTAVKIESASISAGGIDVVVPNMSDYANTVALRVREAMLTLYANGAIPREGGVPVKVQINGLRNSSGTLYNGDGVLSVDYVASPELTNMVSNNVPRMLKSYYPKDDPEGIWTFVFDRNLINDGSISLVISCGNPMMEKGGYYYEELLPTVDGATLTFDLTDKVRNLDDYLSLQDSRYVEVKLSNVRDINGLSALGGGEGLVGSYDFSLPFDYLEPQNLVCEFDPPTGTSLNGVDEIEIWYNNASVIGFDGVEFTYHTDNGFANTVVLKSELSLDLSNNEMTIRCKVPEAVKGHDQVTVKLYNMTSIDGYDYQIQAQYDMFVVDLLSPIRPGESIASTGDDDFVFNINLTDRYFYLRYDFYNAEGPEGWVYGSELHQQNNGLWTGYNGNFPCYTNYEPRIVVSAYYFEDDYNFGRQPAETFTFKFVGTTEPFAYSDVKFVSIDPEQWSTITPSEDFCFTVIWDGLVNVDAMASGIMIGMGMGVEPFEAVIPVYSSDEYVEGYSNIWLLYPGLYVLENNDFLDISIYAKDENGAIVEGNMGAGDMDYLQFSYSIYNESSLANVNVTPEPYSVVDKLSEIIFSYPGKDVGLNYAYQGDVQPRILDENFNVVAEYGHNDFSQVDNGEGNTALKLTIETISAKGLYMLFVPEEYMLVGDQFDVSFSASIFCDFTVLGTEGIGSIVNDGTSGTEAYTINGVRINPANLRPGLYIINGQKVYIK